MRKSVWIFLLAVLLPSALLGWLALRSAEEQKIILERRTAELYQRETEALATAVRAVIDEQRRTFADITRALLAKTKPSELAREFASQFEAASPRKVIGFAIDRDGLLCSPAPRSAAAKPEWQTFLWEHGAFLGGGMAATVYNVPVDALTQPETLRRNKENEAAQSKLAIKSPAKKEPDRAALAIDKNLPAPSEAKDALELKRPARRAAEVPEKAAATREVFAEKRKVQPQAEAKPQAAAPPGEMAPIAPAPSMQSIAPSAAAPAPEAAKALATTPAAPPQTEPQLAIEQKRDLDAYANTRQVQPQQTWNAQQSVALSSFAPETAEFRALTAGLNEGLLARFVQDKLSLVFWLRPPQAPELIFGCVIDAADLHDLWPAAMPPPKGKPEFVLALLDDKARPVATAPTSENGRDWKRPLVASEIGEALPHWEAALYLMRPEQLAESALGLRRTLTFFIVGLLGAIALGGWLVVADARRQFALAQQKTDFVSNVSHELKTPLTSIRMFAELMHGGRADATKTPQYLRIIMVEAERLTRLINNVLDFAKLERRQKRFEKKPLDLHAVIERLWEGHELHLRESGFSTNWQAAAPPYPVIGDEDALAQILVNLLSNAEKYCGDRKEIELHSYLDELHYHVCVSVLDRGLGVPPSEENKIFEAFYRAHDSLSSGIQGSGLGLTLAQRLAREHGGEITYRAREGGGSDFTLRLPLAKAPSA
jgi:signal transduction histidine kinase